MEHRDLTEGLGYNESDWAGVANTFLGPLWA